MNRILLSFGNFFMFAMVAAYFLGASAHLASENIIQQVIGFYGVWGWIFFLLSFSVSLLAAGVYRFIPVFLKRKQEAWSLKRFFYNSWLLSGLLCWMMVLFTIPFIKISVIE